VELLRITRQISNPTNSLCTAVNVSASEGLRTLDPLSTHTALPPATKSWWHHCTPPRASTPSNTGGSQVERRRRENRGGEGVRSGEGLCPFPENFSSQNGMIWCILDVLFLRFTCPMDCSCMINFIEVPVCAQILGSRQHRTTPAGQILGGGVATPATPAALTPMHAARRRPYHSVCRARPSGVTIIFGPPANSRYGP